MSLVRKRNGSDLMVGQMSIGELQVEIERRVQNLRSERADLEQRIAEIDAQLESVAASAGAAMPDGAAPSTAIRPKRTGTDGRRGPRARNERPLWQYLVEALEDRSPQSPKELAERIESIGYESNAQDLSRTITATLSSRDEFERVARGQWGLAAVAATADMTADTTSDESGDDGLDD